MHVALRSAGDNDHEFITAETCQKLPAGDGFQPLRDFLQEDVADSMTKQVIDAFEAIEVNANDAEFAARQGRVHQRIRHVAVERRPVRQVRQRIVIGEMGYPQLSCFAFGRIFDNAQQIAGLAVKIIDDHPMRPDVLGYGPGHHASAARRARLPVRIGSGACRGQ